MAIISGIILNVLLSIHACSVEFRDNETPLENNRYPEQKWQIIDNINEVLKISDIPSSAMLESAPQTQEFEMSNAQSCRFSPLILNISKFKKKLVYIKDSPTQAGSNSANPKHSLTITTPIADHWQAARRLDTTTPSSSD